MASSPPALTMTPEPSEPHPPAHSGLTTEAATKPEASWKTETQEIPKNRLVIVFLGLMASVFLAALDQTIIATALPTIVYQLGGGNDYSWVGTSFLLAAATLSPLIGKLCDLMGRKPVLFSSISVFLIGSALSGAAQNIVWLIVCRAVQGLGGGGIMQLVFIIISDITPLKDRAKYGGLIGATFGIASVMGPLLGGLLTDHVSWRWCFYINLPTGGFAMIILFFFLKLNPHKGRPFREHVREFDFIGLFLIIGGVVCLLLGFNYGLTSWSSPQTIALITIGGVLLVSAGFWETFTTRSPIIPGRIFKTRTTSILLVLTFFHAMGFLAAAYYLPLYFQVLGASATGAGVKMLPFSLGASLFAVISGGIVTKSGRYRPVIWIANAVFTVGLGLMSTLDRTSNVAQKVLYPLVAAIGLGALLQTPLIALQAAMPIKDVATTTSTFGFVRLMGGTVGISVGQVIFVDTLRKKLSKIPGLPLSGPPADLSQAVKRLKDIPDPILRGEVIQAFAQSISRMFLVNMPIIGFCFGISLLLRHYTLQREWMFGEKASAAPAQDNNVEKPRPVDGYDVTTPTMICMACSALNSERSQPKWSNELERDGHVANELLSQTHGLSILRP